MRCYLPVFLVALVLLSLSIIYTKSDHRGHLDQAPGHTAAALGGKVSCRATGVSDDQAQLVEQYHASPDLLGILIETRRNRTKNLEVAISGWRQYRDIIRWSWRSCRRRGGSGGGRRCWSSSAPASRSASPRGPPHSGRSCGPSSLTGWTRCGTTASNTNR